MGTLNISDSRQLMHIFFKKLFLYIILFKWKLRKIKFSTKNPAQTYPYIPQECSYGAPKIYPFWSTIMHWNEKEDSHSAECCKKILIVLKNASKESCTELHFPKNLVKAYLYLPQEWSNIWLVYGEW